MHNGIHRLYFCIILKDSLGYILGYFYFCCFRHGIFMMMISICHCGGVTVPLLGTFPSRQNDQSPNFLVIQHDIIIMCLRYAVPLYGTHFFPYQANLIKVLMLYYCSMMS